MAPNQRVAVVIPCYRVAPHIGTVIRNLPSWVWKVVVVDDCSPDNTAELVMRLKDRRVVLLRHEHNQGVGGAMVTGYRACLELGADIVVKMDGDDQMDPRHLPTLLAPLLHKRADYTKGQRYIDTSSLRQMPWVRRWGNLGLSFLVKFACGYWSIFDPWNGFTAIARAALQRVQFDKLARDYFFETSMLAQLNVQRAVVRDVPIPARYGDEKSSLRVTRILFQFPRKLLRVAADRIWTRYFVADFSAASAFLLLGSLLTLFGTLYGGYAWGRSALLGTPATPGQVMIATMPLLLGFQLLLQALNLDIAGQPKRPLSRQRAEWVVPLLAATDDRRSAA